MQLVLASNNAKKLTELQALFAPLSIQLVNQAALGVTEASEPHCTFIENALTKARHAAQSTGLPAIADDSGLCVDALGGAPGVFSARYASMLQEPQSKPDDACNNSLLLERLQGIEDRYARFICVLVAIRSAEDPEPLVALGRWHGTITCTPVGDKGFGYDPLMLIPELNQTVAELSAAVKNVHSHRAIAARAMLSQMREVWRLGS